MARPRGVKPSHVVTSCECGEHFFTALQHGHVALVSPRDAHFLKSRNWSAVELNAGFYVVTTVRMPDNSRIRVGLHQAVCPGHDLVDHKNRNAMDNRDHNLRPCTTAQNSRNARRSKAAKNPYRGVYVSKKKWRARMLIEGRRVHLGLFDTPEQARDAYNKKGRELFGDFFLETDR